MSSSWNRDSGIGRAVCAGPLKLLHMSFDLCVWRLRVLARRLGGDLDGTVVQPDGRL
jgi:hypothetical protein